jgi:hypothetical protein
MLARTDRAIKTDMIVFMAMSPCDWEDADNTIVAAIDDEDYGWVT